MKKILDLVYFHVISPFIIFISKKITDKIVHNQTMSLAITSKLFCLVSIICLMILGLSSIKNVWLFFFFIPLSVVLIPNIIFLLQKFRVTKSEIKWILCLLCFLLLIGISSLIGWWIKGNSGMVLGTMIGILLTLVIILGNILIVTKKIDFSKIIGGIKSFISKNKKIIIIIIIAFFLILGLAFFINKIFLNKKPPITTSNSANSTKAIATSTPIKSIAISPESKTDPTITAEATTPTPSSVLNSVITPIDKLFYGFKYPEKENGEFIKTLKVIYDNNVIEITPNCVQGEGNIEPFLKLFFRQDCNNLVYTISEYNGGNCETGTVTDLLNNKVYKIFIVN